MEMSEQTETPHGFTVVLESQPSSRESVYQETALPFSGNSRPPKEQMPEKLREMRHLYQYGRESVESRAGNFYRQAVFMQDYEDDYPWSGSGFIRYFPTYHDLTTKQLRGYFSWRTKVRKGIFEPIAASCAYLYLYELLNGVGTDSPKDALKKMRDFEAGYIDSGIGDQRMRKNIRRWMLEYAVVNNLPASYVREYADPEMIARDESLAVLKRPEAFSDEEVFSALCVFGGKKTADSPVLTLDPARGQHLFSEAWRCASDFSWRGLQLFTLIFGEKKTRRWYPFSNAVYYEQKQPEVREYALNECRSFQCKNGLWTVCAYEVLTFDKARMQGFLRETDARLRRYLKTGRYLKEKPENDWVVPYIDAMIEADRKAITEASRPKITIDLSGLEQIRKDALVTQDSLLTEEELDEPMEAVLSSEEAVPMYEEAAGTPEGENAVDLPLDDVQIRILRSLLKGEDVTAVLKDNRLMPSMAADFINEALFDEIGDTVVTCEDDRLILIEDYIEDLAQLLGGTTYG